MTQESELVQPELALGTLGMELPAEEDFEYLGDVKQPQSASVVRRSRRVTLAVLQQA